MSKSVGWILPNEIIEQAISSQVRTSGPVSVLDCTFDQIGEQVILLLDVEGDDYEAMAGAGMDVHEIESGILD
jgi:hypothetical protein